MKKPGTFLTTLALALALHPDGLAQEKPEAKPKSPQDKIVKKYSLEAILDKAQKNYEDGTGCRQPLSTKEEKEIFNDFRVMAEAAKVPDTLLLICKSVVNAPDWAIGFSATHDPNIVRAQNPAKLPREQRNGMAGHELAHVLSKDNYYLSARADAALRRDLAVIEAVGAERRKAGNPFSPSEARLIVKAIRDKQAEIRAMTETNREMEKNADLGGAILAAAVQPKNAFARVLSTALHLPQHPDKSCKIDVNSMINGLENVLGKGPYEKKANYTHPALDDRKNNLRQSEAYVLESCRKYYTDPKKNKPNKNPQGHGGR